jgi:hypothetical protein
MFGGFLIIRDDPLHSRSGKSSSLRHAHTPSARRHYCQRPPFSRVRNLTRRNSDPTPNRRPIALSNCRAVPADSGSIFRKASAPAAPEAVLQEPPASGIVLPVETAGSAARERASEMLDDRRILKRLFLCIPPHSVLPLHVNLPKHRRIGIQYATVARQAINTQNPSRDQVLSVSAGNKIVNDL